MCLFGGVSGVYVPSGPSGNWRRRRAHFRSKPPDCVYQAKLCLTIEWKRVREARVMNTVKNRTERAWKAFDGKKEDKESEKQKKSVASAANRTRGPSMATTDFTTKPLMLFLGICTSLLHYLAHKTVMHAHINKLIVLCFGLSSFNNC